MTAGSTALPHTVTGSSFLRKESHWFYYPYGNTQCVDFFACHDPARENVRRDALLLGCGDLRSVLYSVQEALRKGAPSSAALGFVLNDHQPEVLARNLLVLHAIAEKADDMSTGTLVRHIGQMWYSLAMTNDTLAFWNAHMDACLALDWLVPPTAGISRLRVTLEDADTAAAVKQVLRGWRTCDWTAASVLTARKVYLTRLVNAGTQTRALIDIGKFIAPSQTVALMAAAGHDLTAKEREIRSAQIEREIETRVTSGQFFISDVGVTATAPASAAQSVTGGGNRGKGKGKGKKAAAVAKTAAYAAQTDLAANPTMLLTRSDRSLYYAVHYGTFPMEGHRVDYIKHGVEEGMLFSLTQWIQSLLAVVSGYFLFQFSLYFVLRLTEQHDSPPTFKVDVSMNCSGCLSFMEDLATRNAHSFDVIDTSNLADHCGLLNLMLHASVLLKPNPLPDYSIVCAVSFYLKNNFDDREAYLRHMTALPLDT
ncbi:hypothetical protein BC828DRAFT_239673 [Blastocladiella britannica]|nr:hypothetical protein BC828DRAFT_239673 [Blastocladiella britannica]